jgi:predicted nucleic acid-binding protein
LIVDEPASSAVRALYSEDPSIIAWWTTETECASAIARLERDGLLAERGAEDALIRLDELAEAWGEVQPTTPVRRVGRRLLRTHPLPAADALQLAAAVTASEGDPSTLPLVCRDDRLSAAARREGFTVLEPI